MRRLALAAALALAVVPAAQARAPKVRCGGGETLYRVGKLRVFAIPENSADWYGWEVYACFGGGRPINIDQTGFNGGTGSETLKALSFDGVGHLALEHVSDGEGGPSGEYWSIDLRTRHVTRRGDAIQDDNGDVFGFRVSAGNRFVLNADGAIYRGSTELSTAYASDLTLAGNTVYWTEDDGHASVVRSATLPGPADAPESRLLLPIVYRAKRDRCATARTLAASPTVRVLAHAVCRIGSPRRVALPFAATRQAQFAADRWVLVRGAAGEAAVVDSRRARLVASLTGVRAATLLAHGGVAWLADDGRLLAQTPGAPAPTELASAADAPTALASAGDTVYWTAAGTAHGAAVKP